MSTSSNSNATNTSGIGSIYLYSVVVLVAQLVTCPILAKIVLPALLAHEHTGLSLVTRGRMGRLTVSTQHIYTHQPYSLGPDAFYCGLFFSAIGTAHTLMEGTQQTEGRQEWFTIHFSHSCRGEVARQKNLKGSILSTLRLAMLLLQRINDKSAFFELFYIPQRCQRRFCWSKHNEGETLEIINFL